MQTTHLSPSLVKSEYNFYTKKQIRDIEENECLNYQDKVMIRLIFEGLSLNEIRNLDRDSIDYENKTLLTNSKKFGVRIRDVSERTLELIKGALKETNYKRYHPTDTNLKNNSSKLVKNNFIIRPAKSGKYKNDEHPISEIACYHRLEAMDEYSNINVNKKSIKKSGILYYVYNLMKNANVLKEDSYYSEMAWKHFNEYKGTSSYKKYVKKEIIENVYNDNLRVVENVPTKNTTEWWKYLQEKGEHGELLVLKYLEKKYGKSKIEKVKDYYGYDIKHKLSENKKDFWKIEVKTILSKETSFNLTQTELFTIFDAPTNHHIHLVFLDKGNDNCADVKIIKSPVKFLGLNKDMLGVDISNKNGISIKQDGLRIILDDELLSQLDKGYRINPN